MELQQQFDEMLNLGGFHLTKQISNKEKVIEQIPELEKALVDENVIMPMERALGVI